MFYPWEKKVPEGPKLVEEVAYGSLVSRKYGGSIAVVNSSHVIGCIARSANLKRADNTLMTQNSEDARKRKFGIFLSIAMKINSLGYLYSTTLIQHCYTV